MKQNNIVLMKNAKEYKSEVYNFTLNDENNNNTENIKQENNETQLNDIQLNNID